MRPALLLVALLALSQAPLSAQDAPRAARNGGFWIGLGVGAAHLDMGCRHCSELPDSIPYRPGGGPHLFLALGGTLSRRLLLGAQGNVAFRNRGNRDATLMHVGAVGQYYPLPEAPVFLRLGVGVNGSTLAGGGTLLESSGVSASADVGADLWRWRSHTLGPYLGLMLGSNGESIGYGEAESVYFGYPEHPRALYFGLRVAGY